MTLTCIKAHKNTIADVSFYYIIFLQDVDGKRLLFLDEEVFCVVQSVV